MNPEKPPQGPELPSEEKKLKEQEESAVQERREEEFTPEIIGKIMAKVQDVNKEGRGFTSLRHHVNFENPESRAIIQSILENGLLGGSGYGLEDTPEKKPSYLLYIKNHQKKDGFSQRENIRGLDSISIFLVEI